MFGGVALCPPLTTVSARSPRNCSPWARSLGARITSTISSALGGSRRALRHAAASLNAPRGIPRTLWLLVHHSRWGGARVSCGRESERSVALRRAGSAPSNPRNNRSPSDDTPSSLEQQRCSKARPTSSVTRMTATTPAKRPVSRIPALAGAALPLVVQSGSRLHAHAAAEDMGRCASSLDCATHPAHDRGCKRDR